MTAGGPTTGGGLPSAADDRLDLRVGAVAHGGHCVARAPDGRVVFVRHALPGERVLAEVTEERRGYLRADAVEILDAAPHRVTPPCPHAGPPGVNPDGTTRGCGGCDWQHVTPDRQRRLKADVVREQLVRLGGLGEAEVDALAVRVDALPGGPLGWRSRVRYAVDAAGRAGLLAHRSHEVVPITRCRIAVPAIAALDVTGTTWSDADHVATVASSAGDVAVLAEATGRPPRVVSGPAEVREHAANREWTLPADAFWQVHPAAPDTFVAAVLDLLAPRQGESAWDLYGGAGLFAAALAERVGTGGSVTLVEADRAAVAAARRNLADLPQVRIIRAPVERARLTGRPDLVVLDPPRTGAGTRVVRMLADRAARAVGYVACDPAALARDVATFRSLGWRLAALRAFDAFPMTHHVECVALLLPDAG
ncbi:MAG TPA: TRAM domain-containing protein [Micromonosporaceae bacterium]